MADNEFLNDLQDDFFAEADEHLTGIRRGLLALESSLGQPVQSPSLLDDLFRHFHTLKGLSAMIALRPAEQLAHQMESYLRLLRQERVAPSPRGLEALIAGTRLLEQVIAARRANSAPPDIAPTLAQLEQVVPAPDGPAPASPSIAATPASPEIQSSPSRLPAEEAARLDAAIAEGARAWIFEFTPTRELAEQRINVTTIRTRLQEIGSLIHAAPRVTPAGGIAFEFIVASRADPALFSEWRKDGLEYYAMEEPATGGSSPRPAPVPAPTPAPAAAPPARTLAVAPSNVVRVDFHRLDDLMRMVGELVLNRARLEDQLDRLEGTMPGVAWRPLQEINAAFEREIRDLREGIVRVRLVPIGEVFERMQFVVRDLARESQKQVELELVGRETEIDKLVVERVMDPLLHLVRNAVSHGLESGEERMVAGKRAAGRLVLRASTAGDAVTIQVEDDGRGIDAAQIMARARALSIIPGGENGNLSLLDVLCFPGFSTRDQADRASGRGVGMSVVKSGVEALGGTLSMETTVGRGTCFTLELPLTLAIVDALIVGVGDQVFAVPLPSVREVLEVAPESITTMEPNELFSYRGGVLALLRLTDLFHLEEKSHRALYALVVGSGRNAVGLVVDRLLGQQEIVVHALADPLIQVAGISGATELGDGRVVLIVDAAALSRIQQKGKT